MPWVNSHWRSDGHGDVQCACFVAYIICDMIILDIKRSLGGKNLDPLPAVVYKQQFRQKGYKIPVSAVGVNCSCYHLGWQGGGMSG